MLPLAAAGFLGTKPKSMLLSEQEIGGQKVTCLGLINIKEIKGIPDDTPFPIKIVTTDLPLGIEILFRQCPDVIFYLASMVWKDDKDNFDEGMHTNVDLTQ
eukprot:8280173-Ditylum_brightwellii.AAC.1